MEKTLKEMTVRDVIEMPEFTKHLQEVIDGEVFNHRKAEVEAITRGMRLQRTAYDSLKERKVMDAETMRELWQALICKTLVGFSAAERNYIDLIGLTAYKRLVIRINEREKKK